MNFTAKLYITAVVLPLLASHVWASDYRHVGDLNITNNAVINCLECEVRSSTLNETSFVVSWTEPMVDGNAIFFRRLNIQDKQNPVYSETHGVEFLGLSQEAPRIVNDVSGFSIFWIAEATTIRAQQFAADGSTLNASSTIIETQTDIANIEVTPLADGNRLIVWSTVSDSETLSLMAVRVSPGNEIIGDAFELASASSWGSGAISVVAMPQAEFWVAYEQAALDQEEGNGALSIEVRHFSADNELLNGDTLRLDNDHDNLQIHGSLMQDGGVRLIWISQDFIDTYIASKRFNANGKAVGQISSFNPAPGQLISHPQINALRDSSYMLTWRQGDSLVAQIYTYDDKAVGELLVLNLRPVIADESLFGLSLRKVLTIAPLNSDDFVAIWREGDSNASDLAGKIFQHTRTPLVEAGFPVADAGPDIIQHTLSTFKLNADRSSDGKGGKNLSYQWTLKNKPAASNANVGNPNQSEAYFYPDKVGEYEFELAVMNDEGTSHQDTLYFHQYNNRPIANAGKDKIARAIGSPVQLLGRDSFDADNDYLTYTWNVTEKPAQSQAQFNDNTLQSPRFTPDTQGRYVLELTVNDTWSTSQTDEVVIEFQNYAPQSFLANTSEGSVGQQVILDGSGSYDTNRDPLSYQWQKVTAPAGSTAELLDTQSATVNFVPDIAGEYKFSLIVNDGFVNSAQAFTVIRVSEPPLPENEAPIANAGSDKQYSLYDKTIQLDARQSTDPNNDGLTYEWINIAKPENSAASLNDPTSTTPRFTFDKTGTYTFEVVVSDGKLTSSDQVSITLVDHKPVANAGEDITVDPLTTVLLSSAMSYDFNAGEVLTSNWTLINKPANSALSFNGLPGQELSAVMDISGDYVFELRVTDRSGNVATDMVIIHVNELLPLPTPTPEPTVEPTPEPTIEPAPIAIPTSTPAPTVEPTPGPTIEPTPAPTLKPTPAEDKAAKRAEKQAKREAKKSERQAKQAEIQARKAEKAVKQEAKRLARLEKKAEREARKIARIKRAAEKALAKEAKQKKQQAEKEAKKANRNAGKKK